MNIMQSYVYCKMHYIPAFDLIVTIHTDVVCTGISVLI